MKKLLYFCFILFSATLTQAQNFNQSKIIFEGRLTEQLPNNASEKALSDVHVEIWNNDQILKEWNTNKQGRFRLDAPFRGSYRVIFSKEGYVSKEIYIDATNLKNEEIALQVMVPVDMVLFPFHNELNLDFLSQKPVAKATIAKRNHSVKWDESYNSEIQKLIQAEFQKLDKTQASL